MEHDQNKYNRHSIRLKGYDYKQPGMYFITTCSWERQPLFEAPDLRELLMNTWQELPDQFPTIGTDMFVIMPNHIHAILTLKNPSTYGPPPKLGTVIGGYKSRVAVSWVRINQDKGLSHPRRIWQERFYDHIIRNEPDLQRIRQYIIDNPFAELTRQGKEIDQKTWEESINRYTSDPSLTHRPPNANASRPTPHS